MNKQIADFNKIQFINGGKELGTVTLKVKHLHTDFNEYVVVNGVECDYCGMKEDPFHAVNIADVTLCQSCHDHFN